MNTLHWIWIVNRITQTNNVISTITENIVLFESRLFIWIVNRKTQTRFVIKIVSSILTNDAKVATLEYYYIKRIY